MERELWPSWYRTVRAVGRDFCQKYQQIPGWVLVATLLWAALHDRPVSWTCKEAHWTTTRLRLLHLPSPATMSRRIDGVAVGLLWRAVEERLRSFARDTPGLLSFLDGKPLPVGGCTKERDARYGRGAGMMAKGYKLHAVWSKGPLPETGEVSSLNAEEGVMARRLLAQLHGGG